LLVDGVVQGGEFFSNKGNEGVTAKGRVMIILVLVNCHFTQPLVVRLLIIIIIANPTATTTTNHAQIGHVKDNGGRPTGAQMLRQGNSGAGRRHGPQSSRLSVRFFFFAIIIISTIVVFVNFLLILMLPHLLFCCWIGIVLSTGESSLSRIRWCWFLLVAAKERGDSGGGDLLRPVARDSNDP
jgi:hypothetical protein